MTSQFSMSEFWKDRRVLLISPKENNQTDRVDNSSRGVGDDLAYTILKYINLVASAS